MTRESSNQIKSKYTLIETSELIAKLQQERDVEERANWIRALGERIEPEVIKLLWDLRNNMENEDPFVQYEVKLSLHKVTNHSSVGIDMFLENLSVFQTNKKVFQGPKILIDSNILEEFLLRNKTTMNQDVTKVVEWVLSEKINPYVGKNGVENLWSRVKNLRGQEYANRLIIEILSQFQVCDIDLQEIDMEKYPTVNIPTVIQVECAKKYNLDGIITLRDRDFVSSGWPYVYSPALFLEYVESEYSDLSPEFFKEELAQKFIDQKREKLSINWKEEPLKNNISFEDKLLLFQGWKIKKFEVLCTKKDLTSATVILQDKFGKKYHTESGFKRGSINALFTAFDKALSHIVEIEHELKSIYIANLTPGKEGAVTAMVVVRYGEEEVIRIYSHENIIKAYLFAYVKAIIAVYAPNEYPQDIYEEKELMSLYKIGMRDFRKLNFSKVDLSDNEANLSESILIGCNFSNANLSGANLTKTDLTRANLSNANLSQANLSNANLTGVELDKNNQTLFEGTILTNTIMPEIKIALSGRSRIDKVVQLLEQIDIQKSGCRLLAVHSMTTPTWWHSDLGMYFWEVTKKILQKGILIKRVFILPESPTQVHLQVLREQAEVGVEVRYICCTNAKNVDNHDLHNTNVMIYENSLVERNSFTTRMLINEDRENGYISYQQIDLKTDKELFSYIWKKSSIWKQAEFPNFPEQIIPHEFLNK
ncbi:MAG: leuA allosteric domain protein [Okeania sp. SIO3B5]|uniref:pentapeptide repeat-containing protein n=1 Tax=Okeania sp. SIO3B5 TaxID=2607811 RepID=UPI001400DD75|nr:pentapeptide repeat-containing protein [Okeania sp. SIO3B5]NEO58071.1 leuA allosteric domain protein [Okeania sp. SIO3B5]